MGKFEFYLALEILRNIIRDVVYEQLTVYPGTEMGIPVILPCFWTGIPVYYP